MEMETIHDDPHHSAGPSDTDTLYLPSNQAGTHLTLPSLTTVFLQQYCRYTDIHIVLVCENEPNAHSGKTGESHLLPTSDSRLRCDLNHGKGLLTAESKATVKQQDKETFNFTDSPVLKSLEVPKCLQYVVEKYECLPWMVQDCQLPCIVLQGQQMCVSGLASVLRRIIQASSLLNPQRNLEVLLGFRQTCLKGCSESSLWTKLCEVDAPKEVSEVLRNTLSADPLSTPPMSLRKLEELLAQPVATFNSEKVRRKLLKSQGNSLEARKGKANKGEAPTDVADVRGELLKKSKLEISPSIPNVCERKEAKETGNVSTSTDKLKDQRNTDNGERKSKSQDGSLEDGDVQNEQLRSDFNTKVFLCNKKEFRQKRAERKKLEGQYQGVDASQEVIPGIVNGTGNGEMGEEILMQSSKIASGKKSRRKRGNEKKIHKDSLPELPHLFAQGVDVTLTDFAVFVPIHLWLLSCVKNGTAQEACQSVPLLLDWYKLMWDVPSVRQVATDRLAMREVEIELFKNTPLNEKEAERETEKETQKCSLLTEADVQSGVGNLAVSRPVIREMLRKVLPGSLVTMETKGLHPKFTDHPSTDSSLNWQSLPSAVSPEEGELDARRARNKEQQIESIVSAVKTIALPGHIILDFCSGGGHLGIALSYFLPECHVIMIENKEESLRRGLGRVQTLGLKNVTMYMSNIDYFYGRFDIGVSLHACGVATDIVLDKCVRGGASFVSSPCCYGGLHDTHHMTYPRSHIYRESGLSKKEYFLLGHAAEQTSWNFESELAKRAKLCMGYIDSDRAELAREQGYHVTLCSLKPATCSPKNNLLIGLSPQQVGRTTLSC